MRPKNIVITITILPMAFSSVVTPEDNPTVPYAETESKIKSLNDVGDLTYPYKNLNGQTKTLVEIFEGQNDVSKEILNSKKPLIILGDE